VELTGPEGVRRLPIQEFYLKASTVDIRPGEIQTAILIPKDSYENTWGYYFKYAMRNAMDIATTGCSVNVRLSQDKKSFDRVRIAYGVAGPVPVRCPAAENLINGKDVTKDNAEAFALAVLEDIHPRDSWRAAKDFREHIAVELARRCLAEAVRRAGGDIQ
jgi:xanthine dehydrogenase FAD-binding subunit